RLKLATRASDAPDDARIDLRLASDGAPRVDERAIAAEERIGLGKRHAGDALVRSRPFPRLAIAHVVALAIRVGADDLEVSRRAEVLVRDARRDHDGIPRP